MESKTFDHTAPTGNQAGRYEWLRDAAATYEQALRECVPPGRELSIAVTKLEETAMWANKGVSRGDPLFNTETVAPS